MFRHHRNHVVDRGIDPGGGGVAARLDFLVAGVIGDAVDHRLRPGVHVLEAHVGETGDVLQAFGRQRQRERLAEIGAAARRQFIEDAVGMGLELPAPGVAHGARRHRRKHRRAFRHVRIAVLAHHVVAHQRVHQSRRLMRREHVGALFLAEDVVAPREHGRAELRHERDRRFLPHPARDPDRDRPRTPRRRCRNAGRWTWAGVSVGLVSAVAEGGCWLGVNWRNGVALSNRLGVALRDTVSRSRAAIRPSFVLNVSPSQQRGRGRPMRPQVLAQRETARCSVPTSRHAPRKRSIDADAELLHDCLALHLPITQAGGRPDFRP